MNRQIAQLFGVTVVLFAVLIAATSWNSVFGASGLAHNPNNRRDLIRDQRIPRGLILARDGTVLARNRPHGQGQDRFFTRVYPTGPLFSHAVGYSFIRYGRAGLERSRNDQLTGQQNEFSSILSRLENRSREGNDLVTTLDPAAQRTAIGALGGQPGSIVALEPTTGRIRVMASVPDYDPNLIPSRFGQLQRATGSPVLNRATQGRYAPGSTFKVVTAAAALDTGKFTPQSVLNGSSPKMIGGAPLSNFGGEQFGDISLTDALTHSVNTVWAQVGVRLGAKTLFRYMDRFGFDRNPELDYPADQMHPSGVYQGSRLLGPGDPIDIGRVAIGQERLEVTPLQMAEVAAAIANKGKLMRPRLSERVVAKDGRVIDGFHPARQARVMSTKAAGQLAAMMTHVVEEGTGTAAALSGVRVAGKTGTAERSAGVNQAWFIAFAPVDNPKVAIVATVERTSGQGGTVAAPMAKRVLEVLLRGR
ncbi:MAG TPA: penicillin-binding protein 2 [Thermoleophilaceae bacterium]|nr:penicillin-binding protein 2 [Thermoleophilaceae bacterium]